MSSLSRTPKSRRSNDLLTLGVLNRANGPLTAYQILERLRCEGISGPSTVYRSLERLMANGLVHRIETLNAYMLCVSPNHRSPAVFAICEECGSVSEFADDKIETRLRDIAREIGFDIRAGSVELKGSCIGCGGVSRVRAQ